ncbi:uncharacterized protein BDZ99DRAFT_526019 [Mytilinidion resinicola]|uniref:Uncharacterized protein n=1 Tax=Mytilinidion resinicola TaxID=574789 RepID=A0A6A6Y834_9PEZI|nr:uncharacterized protein BDZ99DRAFT_526019 [Mytilinidion resinicola]KAF2803977.1 hypothetical protein BDZ99DRAFT_526019 [Mytilinidion resinicola]
MSDLKRAIEAVPIDTDEESDSSTEEDQPTYFQLESTENAEISPAKSSFHLGLDSCGFPICGDSQRHGPEPEVERWPPENVKHRRVIYTHLRQDYLDHRMHVLEDRLNDNSVQPTETWPYHWRQYEHLQYLPYDQWTVDQKDAFTLIGAWFFWQKYKLNTPETECLRIQDAVAALLLDNKIISARDVDYPNKDAERRWLRDEMRYLAVLAARRLSTALERLKKIQQSVDAVAEAAASLVKDPRDVDLDRGGVELDIANF